MSKIANWSAGISLGDEADDQREMLDDEEFLIQFIEGVKSAKLNVALNGLYEFESRLKRCRLFSCG